MKIKNKKNISYFTYYIFPILDLFMADMNYLMMLLILVQTVAPGVSGRYITGNIHVFTI